MNPMEAVRLEKVTLNIGIGGAGERLDQAKALLERIANRKSIYTRAKARNSTFKVRKGQPIGVKTTLRGTNAKEVLTRCLETLDNLLRTTNFDRFGNVSFGIKEYIDVPGLKYDPKIGMMGFDVSVTLAKPGKRVSRRRIAKRRLSMKQRVTPQEAKAYVETTYGVKVEEPEEEE
ncbi:50S ribosomal protein L5 [Candidatus Micrarchaeota archaeon]|nr:50S ribosomal protein L5 [Candidatus Micrarchaeota archaeon]